MKDSRSDCLCTVVLLMSVLLYLICLVHRERRRRSSAHSQVVTGVTDSTGGQSHLHNHKTALLRQFTAVDLNLFDFKAIVDNNI